MKVSPPPVPTEYQEQKQLFAYLRLYESQFPELAFASGDLNGVRLPMGAAAKAKAAGMKSGKPDIFIPARRGNSAGLFVELKRIRHGRVEPEQEAWITYLRGAGYTCEVAKGSSQALDIILAYMRRPLPAVPPWYFDTVKNLSELLKSAIETKKQKSKNRKTNGG